MESFGQHFTASTQSVCYVRWASEMKILDADSAAMAATVLSYRLRGSLEMHKDEGKVKQSMKSFMERFKLLLLLLYYTFFFIYRLI